MNWHQGLLRILQAFWLFIMAAMALTYGSAAADTGDWARGAGAIGMSAIIVYALYRGTRWILDGFFKAKS